MKNDYNYIVLVSKDSSNVQTAFESFINLLTAIHGQYLEYNEYNDTDNGDNGSGWVNLTNILKKIHPSLHRWEKKQLHL